MARRAPFPNEESLQNPLKKAESWSGQVSYSNQTEPISNLLARSTFPHTRIPFRILNLSPPELGLPEYRNHVFSTSHLFLPPPWPALCLEHHEGAHTVLLWVPNGLQLAHIINTGNTLALQGALTKSIHAWASPQIK